MAHPFDHAKNSAKKFGGVAEDYLELHNWFDHTKAYHATMAHRALRHHSEGIFELEEKFGEYIVNSDGKKVYTRYIGEQHVLEDLGFIPTVDDWLSEMNLQKWMLNRDSRVKQKRKIGENLPLQMQRKPLINDRPQTKEIKG